MRLTNLRAIRLERRLSQRALGERIGVPQTRVSMFERGIDVSDDALIRRLATALKVPKARLTGPSVVALADRGPKSGRES